LQGREPRNEAKPLAVQLDGSACGAAHAPSFCKSNDELDKDKLSSLGSSHSGSQHATDQQQQQQQKEAAAEAGMGGRQLNRMFSPARMKARILTWSYSLGEVCLCATGTCPCTPGTCLCKDGVCACTAPACDCRTGQCPCRTRLQESIRRKRTANMVGEGLGVRAG
jgi:hypothetical protein